MQIKYIKKIFIVATLLILTFSFKTKAEVPTNIVGKVVEKRCEIITNRIEVKLTNYATNQQEHKKIYDTLRERLVNVILLAKDKGYDVTALETDLKDLDTKVTTFNNTYDTYIEKLQKTKDMVCGKSEGEFINQVVDSRQDLKLLRKESQDIKLLFETNIRKDINSLKLQKTSDSN